MSTESKKPQESGPTPEYKAHFELWSEAAGDNGNAVAASNGRRVWTTPVLSTKPLVASTPPEQAAHAPQVWSRGYWTLAVAATAALLAVLVMRPWKFAKVPSPPVNMAAMPAMKVRASPKAMPSVAIPARQAVAAPATAAVGAPAEVAVAAPMTSAAMPSTAESAKPPVMPPLASQPEPAAIPSNAAPQQPAAMASTAAPIEPVSKPMQVEPSIEVPLESAPAVSEEEEDELAPERKTLLESSLRSELAREGFSAIGVSVAGDGDVFLNGTFLSPADRGRVIAMVRGHQDVRDIYFSGSVWHEVTDQAGQATAPSATPSAANVASAFSPDQPLTAKPQTPPQQPLPSTDSPESAN